MSHHLDSPASRRDPRLNVTDVYAFDSNDATVLTMIVNSSLAGAGRIQPAFIRKAVTSSRSISTARRLSS